MAARQDERTWLEQRRHRDGVLQVWHQRTPSEKMSRCKDRDKKDGTSNVSEDADEDYVFKMRDEGIGNQRQPARSIQERGLMVDTSATSHIITDITMFKSFDCAFRPEMHSVELADGIFSVKAATTSGATVVFKEDKNMYMAGCIILIVKLSLMISVMCNRYLVSFNKHNY